MSTVTLWYNSLMQVVLAPDVKLRIQTKRIKKITPALVQTLKEMVKLTRTFKDPEGVGLASTQVGLDGAFFVAKKEDGTFLTVINPQIISHGKAVKKYFEGCLSTPNLWGEVKRHLQIKVSYLDETGQTHTKTVKGLLAHIFQHEIDHINGIIFQDKVLQQGNKFYKFTGKDKTGADTFEEITI